MGSMEEDPGWKYLRMSMDQQLKDQMKAFDAKKNVWIPDAEEGFIPAEIKSTKGDVVTLVTLKGNEVTLKKDQTMEMNPPKFEKTEDMANLTMLNEGAVLHNLRQRYYAMMIYTYSGLFCVVINPYKRLPIYTESVIKMYLNKRRTEMPPHLFAVADEAYRNMIMDRENQSMLITGESGAGKTENTKKVIAYFAIVGATQMLTDVAPDGKKKVGLEEQIVQTNPVLEAFGNAKTVRNNNSSRFGKFIRTHFSKDGKLAGGDIEHYLLEKSRVIKQAPGERCYHIFYQIMSGQIQGLRDELKLKNELRYYHFCAQAELTIDGVDDKEEMKLTDEAFDIMGFTAEEKLNLFRMTAAIMHMGEMKFKQRPREEQAETDGTEDAENACSQYGVPFEDFLKSMLKPRVRVGKEWVNKGQNLEQVHWAVGALAKAIYARMFHWLIKRCNKTLDVQVEGCTRKFFIGVLDIAGFEIFDFNSFEQLWINFVNERLQQFFNHHMFVLEQEEYSREGIVWEFIDFGLDLQQCIELIEKPMGIISMMDEECIVPKATDMTLVQKLNDQHLGKHPNFQKPKPPKGKQAEAHFAIGHYAGTVRYNCTMWLEKNKDPLNDSAVAVLKSSANQLVQDLWADYQTQEEAAAVIETGDDPKAGGKKKGKSSSFMTVSMMYRESLNNLMHMLHQTHPHFIRCIIPNEKKASGVIDAALCLNQLSCNGVLEGIRICRKGFPNRLLYADFRQRYCILAATEAKSSPDAKIGSTAVMKKLEHENLMKPEEYRIGDTKIFFKAGVLARMEEYRDHKLSAILTAFNSRVRSFNAKVNRKKLEEQKAASIIICRNIREWLELRQWFWFRLYGTVKPLIKGAKAEEEIAKLEEQIKALEETLGKESKLKSDFDLNNAKILQEKNDLCMQLQSERDQLSGNEDRLDKLQRAKAELEKQVKELTDKLAEQEDRNNAIQKDRKKTEQDLDGLRKQVQDLELSLKKSQAESQSRDHQIRSLQDEMGNQDEGVAKLNKEKKHQEEVNKKLTEDLQAEEDKVNHLNKLKAKLETTLDDLEDSLEREKHLRQDVEKAKRKAEGDLKVANENIEELTKQKHDIENSLKRKEQEVQSSVNKLEDEQALVAKLQKNIKEIQARIQEMEEELEAERQARSKTDRAKSDLQRELEELAQRLDEAGGSTAAQIEMNKKREAELAKLRRDLEEANMNHENQLTQLRKKHNDAVAEMGDQLDQLQKAKAKADKERLNLQREIEEMQQAVDREMKMKSDCDKQAKVLEVQLAEIQAKCDEQTRQLGDFATLRGRLANESGDLARQLEDADNELLNLQRVKLQLNQQLEESKHAADEESKERQLITGQLRNVQHENDTLREQLDEETAGRDEATRQLGKANAEIQQWKAKFEEEALAKMEEIEEAKRKLAAKCQELQEQIEGANTKIQTLDKQRHRLMGDLDDAQVQVENAYSLAQALEKKQKGFDKTVEEWQRKCADVHAELDASQRDNRNLSTEVFKLKSANDELMEQIEGVRRENKNLGQEVKDLSDQLGEGGRALHELQKMARRLEVEKEELQQALDEAESALEAEEGKVLRAQIEVQQIRQDIEKRIREKEEEFENTRKNHQRALDSMQASLENETKGRAEAMRIKKKLETDINELEIALDHANKANADAQKNIKKYIEQIKELQMQVEEEQRQRDETREQLLSSEKRCAYLQSEKEELAIGLEQNERARRQLEQESADMRGQVNELAATNSSLTALKRKVEGELQALHTELEEGLRELKNSEEQSKKAQIDAARLADELRQEQEHSTHIERMRKALEQQIKDLQTRLDEAEAAALKGGKKIIEKLEKRVREVEQEVEGENRRHQETEKNYRKQERRGKELQFQVDEDKKNADRMGELVEKLQQKIKIYKRQIEEAEEIAAVNLAKFRQLTQQLDDADERADMAENSLSKLRAKSRSSATPGAAVASSASGVFRSPSRARASGTNLNYE